MKYKVLITTISCFLLTAAGGLIFYVIVIAGIKMCLGKIYAVKINKVYLDGLYISYSNGIKVNFHAKSNVIIVTQSANGKDVLCSNIFGTYDVGDGIVLGPYLSE